MHQIRQQAHQEIEDGEDQNHSLYQRDVPDTNGLHKQTPEPGPLNICSPNLNSL